MGCVQSRKDIDDAHPDEYCVINIDERGNGLWAGRLEVTDVELVLNRRGKEPTRWPLRSLRRYGFDGEVFSFESGRRCATGEGIYAFKCRRAEQLFNALQQCIQSRNRSGENALDSLSAENPPGTLPRPIADSLRPAAGRSRSEYLEPAPQPVFVPSRFTGIRSGSVGSGPLSPEVHSPGSPSSSNILEVMPLAPLPAGGAQVTNLYQLREFPAQREHNNNGKAKADAFGHSYLNTGDVNADLASLRRSLQSRRGFPDEDEFDGDPACGDGAPLSPTPSVSSEHYATLAVAEGGDGRLYMNLAPGDPGNSLPPIREEIDAVSDDLRRLRTPKTSGFSFADLSRFELEEEKHDYANLGPGEVNYDPRLFTCRKGEVLPIMSGEAGDLQNFQTETTEINYAVLDLDKIGDSSDIVQGLPLSSPKKPAIGYTIIDFNKTEALTSVALGTEVDTEGSRKTRHNSTALPPSPTVT